MSMPLLTLGQLTPYPRSANFTNHDRLFDRTL